MQPLLKTIDAFNALYFSLICSQKDIFKDYQYSLIYQVDILFSAEVLKRTVFFKAPFCNFRIFFGNSLLLASGFKILPLIGEFEMKKLTLNAQFSKSRFSKEIFNKSKMSTIFFS